MKHNFLLSFNPEESFLTVDNFLSWYQQLDKNVIIFTWDKSNQEFLFDLEKSDTNIFMSKIWDIKFLYLDVDININNINIKNESNYLFYKECMNGFFSFRKKSNINLFRLIKLINFYKKNKLNELIELNNIKNNNLNNIIYIIYNAKYRVTKHLEKSGFILDYQNSKFFKKQYENNKSKIVYAKYNIYNKSGRFSSTNKHFNCMGISNDETRKEIKPKNNLFIYYDYVSFEFNIVKYLIKKLYNIDLLVNDDVYNFVLKNIFINITDRDIAKIFFNSFLYGAGEIKLKQILDGENENMILQRFYDSNIYKWCIKLKEDIYSFFVENQFIQIIPSYRRLYFPEKNYPNIHSGIIFNYYVKNIASDFILTRLDKVINKTVSDFCLFLHDGVLFDYSKKDDIKIINRIKIILENGLEDDIFDNYYLPIAVSSGKNFYKMKKII